MQMVGWNLTNLLQRDGAYTITLTNVLLEKGFRLMTKAFPVIDKMVAGLHFEAERERQARWVAVLRARSARICRLDTLPDTTSNASGSEL